jgi:hypothetical protein
MVWDSLNLPLNNTFKVIYNQLTSFVCRFDNGNQVHKVWVHVSKHNIYNICESNNVGCGMLHVGWYLFLAAWNVLLLVCAWHFQE